MAQEHPASKLDEFRALASEPLAQNERLFEWLSDDDSRAAFYAALRDEGCPVLRFRSVPGGPGGERDVYLVSSACDIRNALQKGSVAPYAQLDSGGIFMLGLDEAGPHGLQRAAAAAALAFDEKVVRIAAREGMRRASVLPLKGRRFDLPVELAEEAALRFVELLFGFRDTAHRYLRPAMRGAYTRLSFQIVGRHFVADAGLPPLDAPNVVELRANLENEVHEAARGLGERELRQRRRLGLPDKGVIQRLLPGGSSLDRATAVQMIIGLAAGTIGNVQAAVCIAIADFFRPPAAGGDWGIDLARAARAAGDEATLGALIDAALLRNPPAAFLARVHRGGIAWQGRGAPVPTGATLLLALGAEPQPDLLFGGDAMHHCVGRHLARPLVLEITRALLGLPGLRPAQDDHGQPVRLEKRWGVICTKYALEYQRERRLVQQPLHVVLPLKEPVAESAARVQAITRGGAYIVEDALDEAKHVHFAWFMLVEGGTHLAMMTAFDGDFDAYVEHFATAVDLFDEQLKWLADAPPLPVREHPKAFVEWIRKHNRAPMGGYFYSAYPKVSASRIDRELNEP